jgi:lipid-binding SYLF domain-containing protein
MKKLYVSILLSCFFLTSILNAGLVQERRILTSTKILKDIFNKPDTGITKEVLKNAKAIAIFPNTRKGAFFVGASAGEGVMSVKDPNGKWSEPIFMELHGASVGMQFGFESTDIVMIFKTERSLDGLSEGKTTIGLDAGVVAFAKGVGGAVKTDQKIAADIQSFGKRSGVFVGISLSGASLRVNDNDDFDYYDGIVYVDDIIRQDKIKQKSEAAKLKEVLKSF